jgi:serine/threonine protein phosphatase PrpC
MLARTTSMSYEFASAENIGDRKEQQDRVAIATHPTHPDVLVAVVADGMGGHKGGALASQAVVEAVLSMFEAFVPGTGSPHDWLTGMLMAAHERVTKAGRGHNRDPRSTGVVALVQKHRIDWAHCGDSRLYAFHNGEYASRTDDHSMVDILVKHGEITEDEALLHPDRSKLFTSLGGPETPQIAYGSIEKVEPGDTVLLASDGLWTYFRNRELAALSEYRGLTAACDRLVELARRRAQGNGDNLSVAMIRSGGGARKGLFGGLFNAKPVAPSPLEDSRRFLLAYLRNAAGSAAEAAARRIEQCADESALRMMIIECTPLFASMSNRTKAAAFIARALDLLD